MDIKARIGKLFKLRIEKIIIMKFYYQESFKPLEIYLMNDQPFTCPHCGSRCEVIGNFYHTNAKQFLQHCLNIKCGFVCIEEEDEYFLRLWKII